MIDVLPFIANILSDLADVELAFPDIPCELPVIVLTEYDNSSSVILSGMERFARISLQTDVFAYDLKTVKNIAADVSSRFAEKGIRRSYSHLITDEDVPRMCMRFVFGVDTVSGRVVK